MFENITAEVLNRLLGSYVSPSSFQTDRVSTSVYNGHVLLSRLELREDALDRLLLPVTLKKGIIMKAEVSIPWTQLGSKPVEITLDGVYLFLKPKLTWTDDEIERRSQAAKAAKLVQAEFIKRSKEAMMGLGKLVDGSAPDASFTSRLVSRITDNVEVRVKDVHIRFDDGTSFSFGITLESLSMQTCDPSWKPRFKESHDGQTYKLCTLDHFSMYGDHPRASSAISAEVTENEEGFIRFFRDGILHKDRSRGHHYLVKPMDGTLKISMSRETPSSKFEFFCKSFDVRIEPEHMTSLLQISKIFATAPPSSVILLGLKRPMASPLQDPKAWWHYAHSYVLKQLKNKRYKWSKAYFAKRRRDRMEYTLLWKRNLVGGLNDDNRAYAALTAQDKVRMEWLEKCLEFNDIILFRSYAENELRLEKAHHELWELTMSRGGVQASVSTAMHSSNAAAASGWVSWALGMSNSNNSTLKESLSQQDVERFLALLRHNPAATVLENANTNDAIVAAIVTFTLKKGSIYVNPIRMSFHAIDVDMTRRMNGSTLLSLSIEYFQINDGFRRVLGPRGEYFEKSERQRSATMEDLSKGESFWNTEGTKPPVPVRPLESLESLDLAGSKVDDSTRTLLMKKRREDSLLFLKIDTNPAQIDLDHSVIFNLAPVEIVYSSSFVKRVEETLAALPAGTSASSGSTFSSTSRSGARRAIAINLDIRNPLFIMPSDPNPLFKSTTPALILDLGRFSIQDQAIRTKTQIALAIESQNAADERFFDDYSVHLSRIFIWMFAPETKKKLVIIDRFSARAVISKCVQSVPKLPSFKLAVESLELINFRLSAKKIQVLFRVADSLKRDGHSVDDVEVVQTFQECAFVHPVPHHDSGDDVDFDERALILEQASPLEQTDGRGHKEDLNETVHDKGTVNDFDASSEFFSVIGDEIDDRGSFVARNQRFFDALNGDDAQSESRSRLSRRRSVAGTEPPQISSAVLSGPGTVTSDDDQRSFFTADSGFRRSKSQRLTRRVSQTSSRRDDVKFQLSCKFVGFAVYMSSAIGSRGDVLSSVPSTNRMMGSPLSAGPIRNHPILSIKRNGSSSVSGLAPFTPGTAEKRDLPKHVQSWLEELRQLDSSMPFEVPPIALLPSSSPPPLTVGSGDRKLDSRLGNDDQNHDGMSSEPSYILFESDNDTENTEPDAWEGNVNKSERVSIVMRADNLGLQLDTTVNNVALEFSVGQAVLEEMGAGSDESIFSRYLFHSGLRLEGQDKLSIHGEDEDIFLSGYILLTPILRPQSRSDVREPRFRGEASVNMLRPIDFVCNERVLGECVVPMINELSDMLVVDNAIVDRTLALASRKDTIRFEKIMCAVTQVRSWAVNSRNCPLAMVKSTRLELTIELDANDCKHTQGRLQDVEGEYFIQGSDTSFSFLSRASESLSDPAPLVSFIGIVHPTVVVANEVVIVPPVLPAANGSNSVFLTEEDIADHVIDSILHTKGTRSNAGSPAAWSFVTNGASSQTSEQKGPGNTLSTVVPTGPRVQLESLNVHHQGEEVFVNVLPVKISLCEPLVKHMLSFLSSITNRQMKTQRMQGNAKWLNPCSCRFVVNAPTLELVDLSCHDNRKHHSVTISCARVENANNFFLTYGAGDREVLLERTDTAVTEAFIEVDGLRISAEPMEFLSKAVDQYMKTSISGLEVKVSQDQILILQTILGMYADIAIGSASMSSSGSSMKSLFQLDVSTISISLVASMARPLLNDRRSLVTRHTRATALHGGTLGSGTSSPSSRPRAILSGGAPRGVTSTSVPVVMTPTCVATFRINNYSASVVDFTSIALRLDSLYLQQGYSTVRKSQLIQLLAFPLPLTFKVQLDTKTFFPDSISLRISRPRLVYVPETVVDLMNFAVVLDASKATSYRTQELTHEVLNTIDEEQSSRKPFSRLEVMVDDAEIWLGGGNFSNDLLVTDIAYVRCEHLFEESRTSLSLERCSTSIRRDRQLPMVSASIAHNQTGNVGNNTVSASLWSTTIEEEEQARLLVFPFDITAERTTDIFVSVSPVRVSTSYNDILAVATVFNDLKKSLSGALVGKRPTITKRPEDTSGIRLQDLRMRLQNIKVVHHNAQMFPIARLIVENVCFGPAGQDISEGSLRIRADHLFKRDWEVLMEECEVKAKVWNRGNKISVFCERPIQINLMQSLFDGRDSVREESEKIKHLLNHTGLSLKRIIGKPRHSATSPIAPVYGGDGSDEYFCVVGESLRFRLGNKSAGRAWLLDHIVCPRRGQVARHLMTCESDDHTYGAGPDGMFAAVTIVLETDSSTSSLIIKSPLTLKNETPQPLELAIAMGPFVGWGVTQIASESMTSLASMDVSSDVPSRSTTPDSADTLSSPPSHSNPGSVSGSSAMKRSRSRSRTQMAQFAWSITLAPNEIFFVAADMAQIILSGRCPLLARPRAHVSGAPDFAFAELRPSNSAQLNQRTLKKSIAFSDYGSFSSVGSQKETSWTSYYVVESRWTDAYSQCIAFSAPVVLSNHLNCSATYKLVSDTAKAEGQLPVGAELKWHGQPPAALHLLRLSLKIDGFEWSEAVALINSPSLPKEDELRTVSIDVRDDADRSLRIEAAVTFRRAGRLEVTLSVPFWIVNNTDMPVLLASSRVESLGSRVSAGQTRTIARMRRIRLVNQVEDEAKASRRRTVAAQSNHGRIVLTASPRAPTGLLELLETEESNGSTVGMGETSDPFDEPEDQAVTSMNDAIVMFASSNLKIRFWDSRWSDTCSLDHSSHQVIECKQEWRVRDPALSRALYVVSVRVEQSKSYPKTKIVTLSPRFVLANGLSRAIKVRQWRGNLGELAKARAALSSNPVFSGSREAKLQRDQFASTRGSGIVSLQPGERLPFHWRDKSGPRQISACFDEFGWEWSSGILVEDCVGEFCSRLRNRHTQRVYILRVDVQVVDGATVLITFRPELPGLPPYRIDNLSLQTIRFRQVGAPLSSSETLLPYHSCAYTWDLMSERSRKLLVETIARTDELDGEAEVSRLFIPWSFLFASFTFRQSHSKPLGTFSLDKHFGLLPSALPHVGVSLHADGPTRVLTISDARVMSAALAVVPATQQSPWCGSNPPGVLPMRRDEIQQTTMNDFKMELLVNELGVSLIEESTNAQTRREFLRVCLRGASFRSSTNADGDPTVETSLGDIQIDNQLVNATYPVLLCSNRREMATDDSGAASADFLVAKLVRSERFPGLDFLKSFTLSIAPIQLNLEAEIIHAALRFFSNLDSAKRRGVSTSVPRIKTGQRLMISSTSSSSLAVDEGSSEREEGLSVRKTYVEDLRIDPIEVRINFRGALSLFGGSQWLGAHLEGASVYLREFRIVHSLLSASDPVAKRILVHYMQALRRQWYVLVSSVDLFGDPIGLAKTIFQGMRDSIIEVILSISWDGGIPQFKQGIERAAWILLRAFVSGFSSSVVNVCNGASAALVSVSSSAFTEVEFGSTHKGGIFEALAKGVSGLVVLPYRGFEREGGRGLVVGMLKGAVGVFAQPMAASLRLVGRVAESLRGAVDPTSKVRTDRARTPRLLRSEQPLGKFEAHRAEGDQMLALVGMQPYAWLDHVECSEKHVLILTETRLVLVARYTAEHFGLVLILERMDVVAASLGQGRPGTAVEVILYCLPSHEMRPTKNTWGMLLGSERRGVQRAQFKFVERLVRCENAEVGEKLVKLVSSWMLS